MERLFAENLKILRLSQKMSQKQLAEKLKVSFKTISHWESGYSEPSLEILCKLKSVLNCSYDDLLD